jgi:hypothetical protein
MSGKWHGGKGSSPRPYSVTQQTFESNWELAFGKKENKMSPKIEDMKKGTCGCGRSPTGDCCGWHGLTEEQYQVKLEEYMTNREDIKGNEA